MWQVLFGIMAAIGTVGQLSAQNKAASLQQRSNELQTRQSAIAAIREAQMKRAATINEAASMGASGGSAVAGGISSLGSQLGSGLGYASQQTNISRDIAKTNQQADLFGTLGKVGGWGFQNIQGSTRTPNG